MSVNHTCQANVSLRQDGQTLRRTLVWLLGNSRACQQLDIPLRAQPNRHRRHKHDRVLAQRRGHRRICIATTTTASHIPCRVHPCYAPRMSCRRAQELSECQSGTCIFVQCSRCKGGSYCKDDFQCRRHFGCDPHLLPSSGAPCDRLFDICT